MTTTAYYGSYAHAASEVFIQSATKRANLTDRGWVRSYTVEIALAGFKVGTPAQINAAIAQMQLAYSISGQDFRLVDSNGIIHFQLLSNGSMGGVVVLSQPSFSQVDGAALVTRLAYSIVLSAEYVANKFLPGSSIVSYQESLTFSGGHPIRVVRACINGPPVEQITSPQAPYEATQTGTLVTLTANPVENPPIWPDKLIAKSVTPVSADVIRGAFVQQAVSWAYQFSSATPLIGVPTSL